MRSSNIFNRRITPTLTTGTVLHTLLRCKGPGHWRVVWVSILNTHGSATISGSLELKHRGVRHYLDLTGTVGAYGMKAWSEDLFLADGDELVLAIKASTGTLTAELVVQALHFGDAR